MNEKALEARRAYKREWAKKNPDKIKKYQEAYWNKKAEMTESKTGENRQIVLQSAVS